jgi:hypothetical protein
MGGGKECLSSGQRGAGRGNPLRIPSRQHVASLSKAKSQIPGIMVRTTGHLQLAAGFAKEPHDRQHETKNGKDASAEHPERLGGI